MLQRLGAYRWKVASSVKPKAEGIQIGPSCPWCVVRLSRCLQSSSATREELEPLQGLLPPRLAMTSGSAANAAVVARECSSMQGPKQTQLVSSSCLQLLLGKGPIWIRPPGMEMCPEGSLEHPDKVGGRLSRPLIWTTCEDSERAAGRPSDDCRAEFRETGLVLQPRIPHRHT